MMNDSLIYVIDDNRQFRESTLWMLEGEGYSVREFSDPEEALSMMKQNNTHGMCCCLLDIRMPKMSGFEFHDQLISRNIDIPVIYMTGHGDIPLAVEAMSKGAITFIEKPLDNNLLKTAINVAFKKSRDSNKNTDDTNTENQNIYKSRLASLTTREYEVLEQIIAGKLNKVIAFDLGISVKTVELHRSRVMSKMKAGTLAELVKMYLTESIQYNAE